MRKRSPSGLFHVAIFELGRIYQITKSVNLVRIATGSWFHFLVMKYHFKKFDITIEKDDQDPFAIKRSYDQFKRADIAYVYGRPLNKSQQLFVKRAVAQGVDYATIRSVIVSDLITPEGRLMQRPAYALVLRLFGWFFNSAVIFLTIVFTAYVWSSPVSLLNKAIPTLLVFVVHGFLIYQMSFYTTKPAKSLRETRLDGVFRS